LAADEDQDLDGAELDDADEDEFGDGDEDGDVSAELDDEFDDPSDVGDDDDEEDIDAVVAISAKEQNARSLEIRRAIEERMEERQFHEDFDYLDYDLDD
jgi:hypothetical protein